MQAVQLFGDVVYGARSTPVCLSGVLEASRLLYIPNGVALFELRHNPPRPSSPQTRPFAALRLLVACISACVCVASGRPCC